MDEKQYCPICKNETKRIPRYPNYICRFCVENPVCEDGRSLQFYNVGMAGGFEAKYTDNGEVRNSHICFVAGKKCWADEARFGGTVIQLLDEEKD